MGIIAANMLELLLPWRFSFFGGYRNFSSKVTIGSQYILLYFLPFLGIATFLGEIEANRLKHKRYYLVSLQNVWPIYEILAFSILVLAGHPLYFMIMIGLSNIFALYNAFHLVKWKASGIWLAIYPIILHCCFFVFMFVGDNMVLANTSIIYLMVIILGAIHHFIESLVITVIAVHDFIKMVRRKIKVKQKKKKPKGSKNNSKKK